MSGLKHTKGPWMLQKRAFVGRVHPVDNPTQSIATVWRHKRANKIKYYHDDEQSSANGLLIAAAPEMLDILISFCDSNCGVMGYCEESKCHDTCALREAKDIVERATGLTIGEAIVEWQSEDRK
ncbi:MAG TPA: hypothetical protein PKL77_10935 [Candidatus Omnitrophota bacterium]|nr:hypothetical protein [Candidatus Omnitrophota bacterium]